jgi:hypothetical protein
MPYVKDWICNNQLSPRLAGVWDHDCGVHLGILLNARSSLILLPNFKNSATEAILNFNKKCIA